MKKSLFVKSLVTAAASFGFLSNAIEINPDGSGQVLLYPYYTVKNSIDTYISVTNSTGKTKAVKIRFSEGKNTWEVLDFNLYLSPYDVWTGAIVATNNGGAKLITRDSSCTVPQIYGTELMTKGVPFNPVLYQSSSVDGNGEPEKDQSLTRLQEGHVEIIEMGNIVDLKAPKGEVAFTPATYIEHEKGVPNDCKAISDAWSDGKWATNRNTAMQAPSGGLYGSAILLNVGTGFAVSYDATAVDNFWALSGSNSAHNQPGTSFPDLNGQVENGTTIVKLGNKKSTVVANGGRITSTWNETIDALSAVMMSKTIANDYNVEAGTNSKTDWVVSFPTKHFYVNSTESRNGLVPEDSKKGRAPFKSLFASDNDDGACESVSLAYYDREERTNKASGGVDFSPSNNPAGPSLCWETSRITFNNKTTFGPSNTLNNIETPYASGWARIDFTGSMVSKEGHRYVGLPVLGFAASAVQNGTLNGGKILANYGYLTNHRRTRLITTK